MAVLGAPIGDEGFSQKERLRGRLRSQSAPHGIATEKKYQNECAHKLEKTTPETHLAFNFVYQVTARFFNTYTSHIHHKC